MDANGDVHFCHRRRGAASSPPCLRRHRRRPLLRLVHPAAPLHRLHPPHARPSHRWRLRVRCRANGVQRCRRHRRPLPPWPCLRRLLPVKVQRPEAVRGGRRQGRRRRPGEAAGAGGGDEPDSRRLAAVSHHQGRLRGHGQAGCLRSRAHEPAHARGGLQEDTLRVQEEQELGGEGGGDEQEPDPPRRPVPVPGRPDRHRRRRDRAGERHAAVVVIVLFVVEVHDAARGRAERLDHVARADRPAAAPRRGDGRLRREMAA